MNLLITGGAGFIGSNFVDYVLKHHPDHRVLVLDRLTYAGGLDNLTEADGNPRYRFIQGDICDRAIDDELVSDSDLVINFAAETHVDRSIQAPDVFLRTNILGTQSLLEATKKHKKRFIQISTDEVYGSREEDGFTESDPLNPSSPYAASKAAGDLLTLSYHKTYGLPVMIIRCSNNYGPRQYPEKLLPLFIVKALSGERLPLYGDGLNRREWTYVEDNCRAIELILQKGEDGQIYNISSGIELTNIQIIQEVLKLLGKSKNLIEYVSDRPGHDRRYSLSTEKMAGLGWRPLYSLPEGLKMTVSWYLENREWWEKRL